MTEDQMRVLPPDWQPHLDVVRDRIRLRCVGEHFPMIAFLYEDGDEREAIVVTDLAREGRPFSEVEPLVRARLLQQAERRRQAKA